jgi:folate-binding protein YgfZ
MAEAISGYAALRESAAWLDVSQRGTIRAHGEDRLRFLHAMASQSVESLSPGQGTYTFFLNAQGQIQADAELRVCEDHVLIETEPEAAATLLRHLERFIIMDDVTLEDATTSLAVIALEGPRADAVAAEACGELPQGTHAHLEAGGVLIARDSLTGAKGLRLIVEAGRRESLVADLERAGALAADAQDFRVVRVENQVPRFGEDFSDATLPHETQRLEAVSFTKGCYLGQEIVERIRSRGEVNRLLTGLEIDANIAPAAQSVVLFEGRDVGRISSPVYSPHLAKILAFAILRREALAEGAEITVKGLRGRVRADAGDHEERDPERMKA